MTVKISSLLMRSLHQVTKCLFDVYQLQIIIAKGSNDNCNMLSWNLGVSQCFIEA
jgi:hypothetical protein